jgi:L-fuconolactonase
MESWQPADLRFYFDCALEYFGLNRVLFGGDWPVATLATSYQRWLETISDFVSGTPAADRASLFQTNTERIYHV